MTLYDLVKLEGISVVANKAGVTERAVQLLRSATLPHAFFVMSDILCQLWEEWDIDPEPLLEATVEQTGEVQTTRLLTIKRAWPELDLEATIKDIHARRAERERRAAAGYVEKRGRKPKGATISR